MNTHTLINCIVATVVLHYVSSLKQNLAFILLQLTLAKYHSVNELDSTSGEMSDIGLLNTSTIMHDLPALCIFIYAQYMQNLHVLVCDIMYKWGNHFWSH